jgi:hypothetical protein
LVVRPHHAEDLLDAQVKGAAPRFQLPRLLAATSRGG